MIGIWIYVIAAVGALAFSAIIDLRVRRNKLRRTVFDNLDSAAANGYFAPGEHLYGMPAGEIAYDLVCYADDFDTARPSSLVPYVREWMQRNGAKYVLAGICRA